MRKVWIDGIIRPISEATVSTLSHAVQRGTTVFDTALVVYPDPYPLGAVVGLPEHVERFFGSMESMMMEPTPGPDEIALAVAHTVAANPASTSVKMIAAWTESPLGTVPVSTVPEITITALAPADYDGPHHYAEPDPLKLAISPGPKIHHNILPPSLKVAAAYTLSIRQKLMARRDGFDDIVSRTNDGDLAEATSQSVFVVSGGTLLIPGTDVVLDGVSRRMVLDLADHLGIPSEVRTVGWDEVEGADEVFASSTNRPVWPIERIGDTHYGTSGPITAALAAGYEEIIGGNHPLSARWLSPIAGVLDQSK